MKHLPLLALVACLMATTAQAQSPAPTKSSALRIGRTLMIPAPVSRRAASALSGFVLASMAFGVGAVLSWWTSLPGWAGTLYPMTLGMGLGGVCTAWVALRRVQRDGLPRRSA